MKSRLVRQSVIVALGVLLTTAPAVVHAQESSLASAKERAKSAPSDAAAALAYGKALRGAGRDADALVELRRGLGLARGRAELAARLEWEVARTFVARREFAQAMNACRTMSKLAGAEAASHVCAAEAHLLWRRGSEATGELAKLEASKPSPKALASEVAYSAKVASGRARELATRDADAEAAYREAIDLAPERAEAHVLLGVLLQRLGRDGLSELRKAAEADPHDAVAQLELGRALPAGSRESIAALERAVDERPTSIDALRLLADGYAASGKLAEAKRTADAVLRLAPNDVLSHVVAGRVALAQGRADDAIKEGETASKLMPNVASAKLLVADAWAHKGEIDLAVESYQAAFGLDHADPTALVHGAKACLAAGRVTSAKAFGLRATKEFPSHGPAWEAYGDALAADHDVDAARRAYETAKKSQGIDPAALDRKLATLR